MTPTRADDVSSHPLPFGSDAARLEAIRRRDARADGAFVFSVRTTGVYCRPSCPARAANAANIHFHATPAAAMAAGFRPCKRCRPDTRSPQAEQAATIADACRFIAAADSPPSLERLARRAALSPFHFHRVFKAVTGVTPRAYAAAHRAARVTAGLKSAPTVTAALYEAGFNASSRFYDRAVERLGMTPSDYRRGAPAITIHFATGTCTLGTILVAATARGVCCILLGDAPDPLLSELRTRFPQATLVGGDAAFAATVASAVDLVDGSRARVDLPLDIKGTAFQQRVWAALRAIPAGQTASYRQVAEAIGQPQAMRAVAQACAANPVAVAIPCHRVVRHDGGLSGYRWGVARKQALLARETASQPIETPD